MIVCRHLEFDGQLKLALHQPRFSGTQRIAIKFRNFVNFYEFDILEERAFLQWKEDVNDAYPGKGKALFQVK